MAQVPLAPATVAGLVNLRGQVVLTVDLRTRLALEARDEGVEPMMKELHAEALRRGLAIAEWVLVVADGAVWIWNAVEDRFPEAVQRLDELAAAGAVHCGEPR